MCCADEVELWLADPSRCRAPYKGLLEPVRDVNAQEGWFGNAPQAAACLSHNPCSPEPKEKREEIFILEWPPNLALLRVLPGTELANLGFPHRRGSPLFIE